MKSRNFFSVLKYMIFFFLVLMEDVTHFRHGGGGDGSRLGSCVFPSSLVCVSSSRPSLSYVDS